MATPGQLQMYNKMEIGEMFGLDHRAMDARTKKIHRVHIYPDEKVPDAVVFHIWNEDHTLGNALRMELLRNENVLFAGYKVPHPLNHMIELRVHTLPKTSPEVAVRHAIANMKAECSSMLDQFDTGVAKLGGAGGALASAPPIYDEPMGGDSDHQGSTSNAEHEPASPRGEERDQRFQEQLEEFERLAGQTSTSFSPSYSPTTPTHAAGTSGDGDAAM
mmetsp:Transcript_127225/g.360082  ORF Transcript_127225/g.360082 Transcript_127225/m.360082 type:complete len:218 (-) Transcript_127225:92-745(-)